MCWDKNSGDWMDAYLNHKDAPAGKVGLMYMISGAPMQQHGSVCDETHGRQSLDQNRTAHHDRRPMRIL